jgi:hypothetical protein
VTPWARDDTAWNRVMWSQVILPEWRIPPSVVPPGERWNQVRIKNYPADWVWNAHRVVHALRPDDTYLASQAVRIQAARDALFSMPVNADLTKWNNVAVSVSGRYRDVSDVLDDWMKDVQNVLAVGGGGGGGGGGGWVGGGGGGGGDNKDMQALSMMSMASDASALDVTPGFPVEDASLIRRSAPTTVSALYRVNQPLPRPLVWMP